MTVCVLNQAAIKFLWSIWRCAKGDKIKNEDFQGGGGGEEKVFS
jgi:hypothetical protein